MSIDAHKEVLEFQAEARQVLKLVIHSLYSNKEIFLRELISNASDACDKLRFEALTDDGLYEGDSNLRVRVSFDRPARTLTISDNGIGMSRQEVADNIGTIARSGTRRFLEALTGERAKDLNLIGQFGVGFYSAFIVADRVSLHTRRAGLGREHGVAWESTGEGQYSIETIDRSEHGTDIVLHLREGEDEFVDPYRLRAVIRRYSDNLSLAIEMPADDKAGVWETVNRASALWTRPRKEITEAEYHDFYKHVAHDFEEPLGYVHAQVEGTQSYTLLLYIPRRAPFDLWERERRHGIKLYVRRVFILEDTERLMPNYLRFVRGVVDSDDLPLNVSREILQHNRQIDAIRAAAVKRVLTLLKEMVADEPDKYRSLWAEFGRVLKEGPVEDPGNREAIAGLLRFASTLHDAEEVSLDDYVARMKPSQDRIYYLTAESRTAAANSPHLEIFRNKGIEVLLLCDRVDEWMLSSLTEYQGKMLHSIAKGDLDLGSLEGAGERQATEEAADELRGLLERMHSILKDQVEAVRLTRRLTDSAACLVVDKDDMTLALRRLLESAGQKVPVRKPILEINPGHALIAAMKSESDADRFEDWAHLLYDQALLSEGGQLSDPALFVRRLNGLLLGRPRPGA